MGGRATGRTSVMNIEAFVVKAFTKDKTQGNPAGVVVNAEGLSDEQMVSLSARFGFSESAFVFSSKKTHVRIRFFSPTQEVNLCGHATIATFHALIVEGLISSGMKTMEAKSGVLNVECVEDGLIVMNQQVPVFLGDHSNDRKKIAGLLNIDENEISNYPIEIVSTGTPKLAIPIVSLEVLFRIKPDLEGIKDYCQTTGAKGFYPFTFETLNKDSDFHARQFNPLAGINEDPITGVAAGALGAYVQKHSLIDKQRFVVEQGFVMNKGGLIQVDVSNGVKVGGYAVIAEKRVVDV